MTDAREWLVMWLRDAHAMEEQAETMLAAQAERIDNYPELEQRIRLHLQETKGQADRLRECLEGMGEGTSVLKDASGKLMATAGNVIKPEADDRIVTRRVRFRTVGDISCTAASESQADTLDDVIDEIQATRISERG